MEQTRKCNHCGEQFIPKTKIMKMCNPCNKAYVKYLEDKLHKINELTQSRRNSAVAGMRKNLKVS